jgi:hypothetical protein
MRTTLSRGLWIVVVVAGSSGCAELARSMPALTVEARATERTRASATVGSDPPSSASIHHGWSWGLGVRLTGALDQPPPRLRPPSFEPPAPPPGPPCLLAEVCVWEARARADALTRARFALDLEALR